ncbi:class I SAM-dependent methyltransferase [Jeongeupia naejangsanensis]|uniref:Class I SAM-dependent methyltransferase n=1 Tax=Jeongeupia naejangsanensis TaxID=613195 RepID=A0ABS2BKA0_9NEIS|nr:class I SAM-dependent methyltransferase [Jeongeupia naejangsanensis]MBM3116040.1 class I SAM-dependent methyltransferase [Jeongeupia naejangsanensis]
MAQNIYDDPGFFAGYSQLRRSQEGLDGAPEWPALQALLPGLNARRVVDLGCGFGWFCRWASGQGAAEVLGVDVSANMLAKAADMTDAGAAISYLRSGLETLSLADASVDLVYSSLALHYIDDVVALLGMLHRALVPGGRLVFSVEHPVYMAPANPGWIVDAAGKKTWPVDGYSVEGQRTTNWLADGVIKYHRTIGSWFALLRRHGFVITELIEWSPTDAQVAANAALAEERERPMLLLIGAERC